MFEKFENFYTPPPLPKVFFTSVSNFNSTSLQNNSFVYLNRDLMCWIKQLIALLDINENSNFSIIEKDFLFNKTNWNTVFV